MAVLGKGLNFATFFDNPSCMHQRSAVERRVPRAEGLSHKRMRFGCESATHLERRPSTIKWLGNGRHSSCTVYMVARFRPERVGATGTNVEPLQSGGRFLDAL
jgi:hypothetical protein